MRLARHGRPGNETPVIGAADGTWWDLTPVTTTIDGAFLAGGLEVAKEAARSGQLPTVAVDDRFGAPLASIGKIICIGLNYRDHAAETGAAIPPEPIMFLKTPDTVVGATDTVLIPRRSVKTDWEVELAVVIGAEARYLESEAQAADVIAGYAISNDVSEREFQIERGGQWDKGKNCETFNPLGPWILTADEVADPQQLGLRLWVNGEQRQNGSTADMIFGVHHLVWYLSQFMVLRPGDVINTGTRPVWRWASRASPTCGPGTSSSWRSTGSASSDRPSDRRKDRVMAEFENRRALVTGGASGIGAAIVDRLTAGGATVAALDVNVNQLPDGVIGVRADVTDDAAVRRAVAEAIEKLGGLDILVNNAGIGAQGGVEDNDDDEWHRVLDVNVVGMVRVTRAALPALRRSDAGAIVNTSSIAATAGLPQRALYSASKGAVLSLTLAMAADLTADGIRVNAVNPGTADTPWVGRLLDKAPDPAAERRALEARQPHGRLVSADEVAGAVCYLASPSSGSTTGTWIAVDGGMAGLRLRK